MPSTTIEPIARSHLDCVHEYASDPIISDTSNVPNPYTREMADDWFAAVTTRQKQGISKVFAILHDGNFAGVISLNRINAESGTADVDFWVAVPYQNKGVATAAIGEVITYAKSKLGLKILTSGGLARNSATHAVQSKNGFEVVEQFQLKEGKFAGEDYLISRLQLD